MLARVLAACTLAAAILTFGGWVMGIPRLTDWEGHGIAQMPNNAVAIAAVAGALLCVLYARRRAAIALAALSAAIAGATLFEHLTSIDLDIDTLLMTPQWGQRAAMAIGRMGVPASASLAVISVSVLLLAVGRWRRIAVIGGVFTIAVAALSAIGYTLAAHPLYSIPRYTAIALQTTAMLLALGAAVVAAVPDLAPVRLLAGDSAAALLARRTLPATILVPIFLGWLCVRGEDAGLFDAAFGTALLVLVLIAFLVGLLLWCAQAVFVHEREVRQSRDRLELLFRKAAFGAALAKLPGGALVDVNDAFVALFGDAREDVVGKTLAELGLPHDGGVRDAELRLAAHNGKDIVVVHNATVVEIGGQPFLLTTVQDITHRKAAEDALRAADRMKDEFLATLSHELRTPLTAIVGWSHMLLGSALDKRDTQVALEAIRSSAKAQAQLIDDVLDVSRITTGKMRLERAHADLGAVVEAAVAAVRPAAEAKRIAVRVAADAALPRIFVDPDRLQQVVWNLLSNAIKFSPERTTVDVVLRAEDGCMRIDVVDQGPGIPREFLPHIFERFRQADSSSSRAHAGLGIGLALSKELVELHGGTILVESEEGRGARFTVRLPVSAGGVAQGPGPRDDEPVAGAPLDGVRVLYVDDLADARHLVSSMLRRHGADVAQASSVDDALTQLAGEPPHVVVTDLAMPERDGFDLLAAMRANARLDRLPVVALTAQGRGDDEARAVRAGFASFLRKPIESHELAAAVSRALAAR